MMCRNIVSEVLVSVDLRHDIAEGNIVSISSCLCF